MGGSRRSKTADVVFEGVLIPKGTRSAKLAANGITTIDEMGDFLTAVFADTLNGKIVLPSPKVMRVPAKTLSGLGQKLRKGLPVRMQGKALGIKRPRRAKAGQVAQTASADGIQVTGGLKRLRIAKGKQS